MKNYYSTLPSTRRRVSAGKMPGRTALLLLLLVVWAGFSAKGQLQLNCPNNITVQSDPGLCEAVVTYSDPTSNATNLVRDTFLFTGSAQTFTVPPGVDSILIEAYGAQGADAADRSPTNGTGGQGGFVSGKLAVSSGQVLNIYVGGEGSTTGTGGYNGGGAGGSGQAGSSCSGGPAGGGGGASDVRVGGTALSNRVIVAGGGGGAGRDYCNGTCQPCGCGGGGGGAGGGVGSPGQAAYNCGFNYPGQGINFGSGGTAASGGTGGPQDGGSTNVGTNGTLGNGGTGSNGLYDVAGGGGGGGYYGGGGGGGASNGSGIGGGGGGGGSGFIDPAMLSVGSTAGVNTGNGYVILEYGSPSSLNQITGLASGQAFPVGVTTNTFQVVQGSDTANCSFTVTVVDSVLPTIACGGSFSAYLNPNCQFTLPDYTSLTTASDNCDPNVPVTQSPSAGSNVSGSGSVVPLVFTATDASSNTDTCHISLTLLDTISPVYQNCPQNIIFTPDTLDCDPPVSWTAPTVLDACGATSSTSHNPGSIFQPGTTTVTYTAADSSGNTTSCSFTVTVNAPVLDNMLTATPGTTACQGQTITLIAAPGFNAYDWSTNQNGPSIQVTTSGIYWVDIINQDNCIGRDSISLNFIPGPAVPTLTQNGSDLCVNGTYPGYQWLNNGNPIPGATAQCVNTTSGGIFSVIVTDNNGCTATSDTTFVVNTPEHLDASFFSIFPNPANNELNVRVDRPVNEPGTIAIYDIAGRKLINHEFRQISGTISLDLSELPEGSFIVEIAVGNEKARKSVVHIR